MTPSPSPSPSDLPATTKFYNTQTVLTTTPTFQGALVGSYNDVLVPVSGPDAEITDTLPVPIGFPFYAELDFDPIMEAFGIADQGSTIAQRGQIYQQAIALLRSFGVEPVKHAVASQATDWDQNSQYGLSYKQVVLTGNIAPPCVAGPSPQGGFSVAFLQKVEAGILSGLVPPGAWIYAWDEPKSSEMSGMIDQLKTIRQWAPHLLIMVTTEPSAATAGLIDMYSPIFDSGLRNQAMFYGSCTAGGTCTNGSVGTPTGTPMMALDADPVHWLAYPVVAAALGAKSALYYAVNESVRTAFKAGGQYKFGNNGDGNLVYAGPNFTVLPSVRLLGIKKGLTRVNRGGPFPMVTDAKHWSKNPADYQ